MLILPVSQRCIQPPVPVLQGRVSRFNLKTVAVPVELAPPPLETFTAELKAIELVVAELALLRIDDVAFAEQVRGISIPEIGFAGER